MNRRLLGLSTVALAAASAMARAATPGVHKIVIHVGGADPVLMATALHNAANAADHYAEISEAVQIELVANGPGYAMVRAGTSPVADLVADTLRAHPHIVLSACQMSRKALAKEEGKRPEDIKQLPGVTDVPAGIVRLSELQEQNFSYIRV